MGAFTDQQRKDKQKPCLPCYPAPACCCCCSPCPACPWCAGTQALTLPQLPSTRASGTALCLSLRRPVPLGRSLASESGTRLVRCLMFTTSWAAAPQQLQQR